MSSELVNAQNVSRYSRSAAPATGVRFIVEKSVLRWPARRAGAEVSIGIGARLGGASITEIMSERDVHAEETKGEAWADMVPPLWTVLSG